MKKVIPFKEIMIRKVQGEIYQIFESLKEDDDIDIFIRDEELYYILRGFYDYYEQKKIVYHYIEMMVGHFEDIAIMAQEEQEPITYLFVLRQLQLLELLDSPIEVDPRDTKRIIYRMRKKFERGK